MTKCMLLQCHMNTHQCCCRLPISLGSCHLSGRPAPDPSCRTVLGTSLLQGSLCGGLLAGAWCGARTGAKALSEGCVDIGLAVQHAVTPLAASAGCLEASSSACRWLWSCTVLKMAHGTIESTCYSPMTTADCGMHGAGNAQCILQEEAESPMMEAAGKLRA